MPGGFGTVFVFHYYLLLLLHATRIGIDSSFARVPSLTLLLFFTTTDLASSIATTVVAATV